MSVKDSFRVYRILNVNGREYGYYSLPALEAISIGSVKRLPAVLKIMLENLLRHEDGDTVTSADIAALAGWPAERRSTGEIAFYPSRMLITDSAGIPMLADLAAMRDAVIGLGGDPQIVNPSIPVDLVVDHSVIVDVAGRADALDRNVDLEYERNGERYTFLRWCERAFKKMRVVPPGKGICHQINLEYLAPVITAERSSDGTTVFAARSPTRV